MCHFEQRARRGGEGWVEKGGFGWVGLVGLGWVGWVGWVGLIYLTPDNKESWV